MSCPECEKFIEESKGCYPYRWGIANVELLGCQKHVDEIFNVLTEYQKDKRRKENERKA